MNLKLCDIPMMLQVVCMVASSLFSIRLIGNVNIQGDMNKFYWYSIIGGLFAVFVLLYTYLNLTGKIVSGVIYRISLVFNFIFLSFLICKALPNRKYPLYLNPLLLFLLMLILFYLRDGPLIQPVISITHTNLGLVLLCCIYYPQIFDKAPFVNLSKDPSFWIITGIFIGMCATISTDSLGDYLFTNINYDQYKLVTAISAVAYGIMHLFFIKGYLCATKSKKSIIIYHK